jgi:hypothetical protein
MDQLGHRDATFTLRVCRHTMRRSPETAFALRTPVGAAPAPDWSDMEPDLGTGAFSAMTVSTNAARP